jgi:hypothetical protein
MYVNMDMYLLPFTAVEVHAPQEKLVLPLGPAAVLSGSIIRR